MNVSDDHLCKVANSNRFKNDSRLFSAKLAIKFGISGKTTSDLKNLMINSIIEIDPLAFEEK